MRSLSGFTIKSIEAHVLRFPIKEPVQTSFAKMTDRPALFLRVECGDGILGWGEVWCNFPGCGAEHRANLIRTVFTPLLKGSHIADPLTSFVPAMTERTRVLAIQSGEPGPLAQCIAGLDIALWDIAAKRAGLPLWQFLGGVSGTVPVYASGLNPNNPEALASKRRTEGHRAFKLKVGFGPEVDLRNARAIRESIGNDKLMFDANQAWTPAAAAEMAGLLADFNPVWLEEPIRADYSPAEWRDLAEQSTIPLAAGENIAGTSAFADAIAGGALSFVQPDVAKWGGVSGCLAVAREALAAGAVYCPHWLGGGVGLLASAHLLAAAGGPGMLEIDANDNPLRTLTCGPLGQISDGYATLGTVPGLGVEPDIPALLRFL